MDGQWAAAAHELTVFGSSTKDGGDGEVWGSECEGFLGLLFDEVTGVEGDDEALLWVILKGFEGGLNGDDEGLASAKIGVDDVHAAVEEDVFADVGELVTLLMDVLGSAGNEGSVEDEADEGIGAVFAKNIGGVGLAV